MIKCPRCESDKACKLFEAEDGSWEVYGCPRCNFNWRSTEEAEVTNPVLYSPRFKLTEKQILELPPKPPIPPLRKQQPSGKS